jgi:PPP family 3-phenylpropionic acid transporter
MATKVLGPNLWGWLADRLSAHLLAVRVGSVVAFIGFSPLLWLDSFTEIALALTFSTFFWNAALPQQEVITLEHLTRRGSGEGEGYGRVRLWGSVGFIFTVVGIAPIVAVWDISIIVPICLGLYFLMAVSSFVTPGAKIASAKSSSESLWKVLKSPYVISILLACFFIQASHGAYYGFFSLHLKHHGYNEAFIGLIWALAVAAEIGIFVWMDALFRRFSLRQLLLVSAVATMLRWQIVAWLADVSWILVPSQLFHLATFGIYHAVAIQLVRRNFPKALQGQGQALYTSVSFGLGGAFGAWVSGQLWAAYPPEFTWLAASFSGLCAVAVVSLGMRKSAAQNG